MLKLWKEFWIKIFQKCPVISYTFFFHLTNVPNAEDSMFIFTDDKEKHQILPFKESGTICSCQQLYLTRVNVICLGLCKRIRLHGSTALVGQVVQIYDGSKSDWLDRFTSVQHCFCVHFELTAVWFLIFMDTILHNAVCR